MSFNPNASDSVIGFDEHGKPIITSKSHLPSGLRFEDPHLSNPHVVAKGYTDPLILPGERTAKTINNAAHNAAHTAGNVIHDTIKSTQDALHSTQNFFGGGFAQFEKFMPWIILGLLGVGLLFVVKS